MMTTRMVEITLVRLSNYLNFARNSDTLLGQGEDKKE
jgi:hypothetical protein